MQTGHPNGVTEPDSHRTAEMNVRGLEADACQAQAGSGPGRLTDPAAPAGEPEGSKSKRELRIDGPHR